MKASRGSQIERKSKRASARSAHTSPIADPQADSIRQRILMAAGRIFSEKGYGDTSIRDISAASGAGLSTILYHFQSKEGLFLESIRHFTLALAQLNAIFAPLFAMDVADRQLVADTLFKTVQSFLHACHLSPNAPNVIGLYTRVLTEGNAKALQMLLDCFADVQSHLPQFCRRLNPAMGDADIAFFQQLLWSQLQYTVVSKRLILYDMKLRDYTPQYITALAWHIAADCCRTIDLPLPRPKAKLP